MTTLATDVKQVLDRALETWGIDEQRMMAVGEFGELLSLFGKDVQGRASNDDWIDEIADAFVLLHQLALIHGESEVEQRFYDKIQRLHCILEGQIEHPHSKPHLRP